MNLVAYVSRKTMCEAAAKQASGDKRAHAHRLLDAELDAEEKAVSDSTSGNADAKRA